MSAEIHIDVGKILGKVPPLVFGNNIIATDGWPGMFGKQPLFGQTGDGVWNPQLRVAVPELVKIAKETGVTVMRYPGGCCSHSFDWKKTVGLMEQRRNYTFGLDEFIAWCRALAAEPLITVSDYASSPQDNADLVEYLNAPADESHPWARKRAAWGHPAPYGVTYFEMGNESYHGNHQMKPTRAYTPEEYASWVLDSAKLMRRIDPHIKIGALLAPDYWVTWNPTVLALTGKDIDFVVAHVYALDIWNDKEMPADKTPLMRACMAAGEQFEHKLSTYRTLIKARTGRDIPLAITEYNAGIYHYKPPLYRFSLGAAIFSADLVRVLLQPETNVLMANYWHFVNDSFGMASGPQTPDGKPGTWKKMPAYYAYRLWSNHFGMRLVQAQFESPTVEFEGLRNVRPARKALPETDVPVSPRGGSAKGFRWEVTGERSLTADLQSFTGVEYPDIAQVKLPPDRLCSLSFEARFTGEAKPEASFGLSLVDSRGWSATHSAIWAQGVEKAGSWRMFRGTFQTQPNCSGATLGWNLNSKQLPSTGRIEMRELRISLLKEFGPYQALTGCASLSADGKMLYLIVFNKHHADDIVASVNIAGARPASGRYWTVTGPSLEATNLQEELVKETVSGIALEGLRDGAFSHVFPAHSMTAIELIVSTAAEKKCSQAS